MIRILVTTFAALAGLAFGSFLNVCLSRWPEGESIVKPRSHCRSCGRTLAWWENIPLVSWLALRGRCRTCGVWIGWRYPLVELAIGSLWAITWDHFAQQALQPDGYLVDQVLSALEYTIFYWLAVALAVLDSEHLWLPDLLTLPGIVIGLVLASAHEKFSDHFDTSPNPVRAFLHQLIGVTAAAFLILLIRWLYKLIRKREGIGLGDAKLMAMLAAWLGLEGALLSFFLGVTLGSIVAVIALATRSGRSSSQSWALQKLPLGTFLCIGGIISALWGQTILDAYLRWAGL